MSTTILYIDDDARNIRLIERMLGKFDCQLLRAYDASSGIAAALREQPQVILIDVMLPDMFGYDVVATLRQYEATVKTPIIMLTADMSSDTYDRCHQAGCNGYLLKPVMGAELRRMINGFSSLVNLECSASGGS